MKKIFKATVISLIVVLLITCFSPFFNGNLFSVFAEDKEEKEYYELTDTELETSTNRTSISSNKPQITVFTHGLFGSPSHWSNGLQSGSGGSFYYEKNSMIEQLRSSIEDNQQSAVVYTVMTGDISRDLNQLTKSAARSQSVVNDASLVGNIGLKGKYGVIDFVENDELGENNRIIKLKEQKKHHYSEDYNNCKIAINNEDTSKHIILIFSAQNPEDSNDFVYAQFEYILDCISYQYKKITGMLPTYNLIGHSRGGITNMQYALAHPYNVASMYSMGTPYNGSAFGSAADFFLELGGCGGKRGYLTRMPAEGESIDEIEREMDYCPGVLDILNSDLNNSYKNYWNNHYSTFSHIRFNPIGTYVTAGFILEVILEHFICKNLDSDILTNIIKHVAVGVEVSVGVGSLLSLQPIKMRILGMAIDGVKEILLRLGFGIDNPWVKIITDLRTIRVPYRHLGGSFNPLLSYADDLFIDLHSQIAYDYNGANVRVKLMDSTDQIYGGKSINAEGVGHNLETHDEDIIRYVVTGLNAGAIKQYDVRYEDKGCVITNVNYCEGSTLDIPSAINGKNVIGIDSLSSDKIIDLESDETYHGDITVVKIPDTVIKIGDYAFYGMASLQTVLFKGTPKVTEIGEGVFCRCDNLQVVPLPSSITKIPDGLFLGCSSLVCVIPWQITEIGEHAFEGANIEKVFYKGDQSEFRNIVNHQIFDDENVYYYSGRKPAYGSHYWRYTSELPEIWKSIKVTSVTPNGSLNQETTTQITFTFSEDPGNLRASDFAFSDGEATYIQGSGNTRIVGISGFNLRNTRSVSVKITPQSEYCFVDEYNNSTIYVKLTPIIYLDKDKDYFSGNFGDDYVDEHIFTETTTLPKAQKVARRLAAWYLMDEDGNYTAIESLPADFHAESVTVYAEWKSNLNMDYFDGTPLEIVYNMRDDKMRAPDVFCGTGDVSQSDLSYMLRESLFPALSRLSIGGYSYELNFDLIRSHELNGNVLTIELFDDYKFSDGSMLRAECFEAYYLLVRSFYADEELPAPWSFISSVTSEDFELQIEFIDNNLNISYFLHEFRAYSTSWVSHDPTHGPTAATSANEANNFCLEGYFPSYGKYKISDYNNYDEICLTANPYYARADETDAPDVNIKIMNTTAESVIRWQTGEYDAYFNMIENDVDGFVDNSESVFHKYDSRVRMLLGVVKNSDFFEQYDEDFICENFLPILFRMIDFNRIAEAFKNSVKEKSSWATDVLIKEFMGDFSEIMVPIMLSPSEGRRMLEDLTGIPKTHMLNFKLFVPSNDICRKIAEIIQENFHEAYISMDLVYGENIEEVIECDLCLFPYDYSGGNLFGKDVLSSDYLKYIFFPRSSQNAELDSIESEYYSESGITERNFFAGELLRIMERYCYKINHIPKGYLSSDDFHNLIYGNVRLLVY